MHRPPTSHFGRSIFAGVAAALVISACSDITAPATSPLAIAIPAAPAAAIVPSGPIVVSPSNLHGWRFRDELLAHPCRDGLLCKFVAGPGVTPLGTGSAEVTSVLLADASLELDSAYAGVRFSKITALSYSTYRQTIDPTNNLAITFQVNVDYDLTDKYTGDMGRLVFEPYRSNKGKVLRNTWQSWDTKAGLWWGTEEYAHVGGKVVKNRCAVSSPCTWAQLLSRYPNSGFHPIGGGIVLKAWKTLVFRGNVDKVVVGVMDTTATTTTYDFELTASKPRVLAKPILIFADTTLAGTPLHDTTAFVDDVISYAYTAKAGFTNPQVRLDGQRVPVSGTIIADTVGHILSVTADRVVTVPAGLEALYATAQTLLTAQDVPAAYQNWLDAVQAYMEQSGYTEAATNQIRDIEFLVFDPTTQMTNLVRIDKALAGWSFPVGPDAGAPRSAPIAPVINVCDTMICIFRGKPSADGSRIGAGPRINAGATAPTDTIETTTFDYMNGMNTSSYEAAISVTLIRKVVKGIPAFASPKITVRHIYNRTYSETGPTADEILSACESFFFFSAGLFGNNSYPDYMARCTGNAALGLITDRDWYENIVLTSNVLFQTKGTVEDADKAGKEIMALRAMGRHVVLVPHSQGNLMINQALYDLGWHPDTTSMSVVSLASPVDSRWTVPDTNVAKIVVAGDPVGTLLFNHWPVTPTKQSRAVDSVAHKIETSGAIGAFVAGRLYRLIKGRYVLHSIDNSYLKDEALGVVITGMKQAYAANVVDHFTGNDVAPLRGFRFGVSFTAVNFAGAELERRVAPSEMVSDNEAVAVSNGDGTFFAASVGEANITMNHNGKTASVHVTVLDPAPPEVLGTWSGDWLDESDATAQGPMTATVTGTSASARVDLKWKSLGTGISYEGAFFSSISQLDGTMHSTSFGYHEVGSPTYFFRFITLREIPNGATEGLVGTTSNESGIHVWEIHLSRPTP
jgi:hypothetical protein